MLAVMLAVACTARPGDTEGGSATASTRFRDGFFNTLFAEHCLRIDRTVDPAEAGRLQRRLAEVRQRATAVGMGDDVKAAERRWTDFAARAEFACEDGSSSQRFEGRIDELVRIMEEPTPVAR